MKRVSDKVKDLVEVRTYNILQDFLSDPAQTLAGYHFTDATSDLMAKWLERVGEAQIENGMALALAGYRGVGKSHFLAVFGAIISNPELRSRIGESSHVEGSAQRLKRRRYPVAYVKRGTNKTLFDELKDAVSITLEVPTSDLGGSIEEVVRFAAEHAGEVPFTFIIDTARDRDGRVTRDDGKYLGEIATLAKELNVFVGVALDDDIAGADGANAAIAKCYSIDYLDQEHLYRIVENHLFPKYLHMRHLLHEIYSGFHNVLPSFRWSEQRFSSLYPLHPIILEIAPFIRLYAPDFALLGFAVEAGSKVLGRPSNSLVALDEVFDRAESSLREASDLKEAFETYDQINRDVISTVPVMQRLHAKMIAKALLLLSLDGDGTTASEISAAMLIYNEVEPQKGITEVEEILDKFAEAMPQRVQAYADVDREKRFSLKVSGRDDLNSVIAEKAKNVPPEIVEYILRRFTLERFSETNLLGEADLHNVTECHATWRGGYRRGRVLWEWNESPGSKGYENEPNVEFMDWEVVITNPADVGATQPPAGDLPRAFWHPAFLKNDEADTIRRYHVLMTDETLDAQFAAQVRAAGHTHQMAVAKIWSRIFLDEGKMTIDGIPHEFSDAARESATLGELMSNMLMPLFDIRYPQHPYFDSNLDMNLVSRLVSEHFSGANATLPDIQALAKTFAEPLGLVDLRGGQYVLRTEDALLQQTAVKEVMDLVAEQHGKTIKLGEIYSKLRREPLGLGREAQHLVMGALVAQRYLEFITSHGDRINRRSLDLVLIWDDVVGIAAPKEYLYDSRRLTRWAQAITASDSFSDIDQTKDYEAACAALAGWLSDWKSKRLMQRFEALPDEALNTSVWKLATTAQKKFGVTATTVESFLEKNISLEEALQRIADTFDDSEDTFFKSAGDLVILEDITNALAKSEYINSYLSICEFTDSDEVEDGRSLLEEAMEQAASRPNDSSNNVVEENWRAFHQKYSEHYVANHNMIMKSHHLQEKYNQILKSNDWWEFEQLSSLSIFHNRYWEEAQKLLKKLRRLDCRFNVTAILEDQPACICTFSLNAADEWEKLPNSLAVALNDGRLSYRKALQTISGVLTGLLKDFAANKQHQAGLRQAAETLESKLIAKDVADIFTHSEIVVLCKVVRHLPAEINIEIRTPATNDLYDREEIRSAMNNWLDSLPGRPALYKL